MRLVADKYQRTDQAVLDNWAHDKKFEDEQLPLDVEPSKMKDRADVGIPELAARDTED